MKPLQLVLLTCVGACTAMAGLSPASKSPTIPAELLNSARSARTIQIEVKQSYGQDQKIELPLAAHAVEIFGFAGVDSAPTTDTPDLQLVVDATGEAVSAMYRVNGEEHETEQYSGAGLSGTTWLSWRGKAIADAAFEAEVPCPTLINRRYTEPSDAPFEELMPEYCESVWTVVQATYGEEPMIAAVTKAGGPVQLAAIRVLGDAGDARAVPAIAELLKDTLVDVRQAAALALGTIGDGSALRPLLLALDEHDAEIADLKTIKHEDGTQLVDVDCDASRGQTHQERRNGAQGMRLSSHPGVRPALLWAVLQVDAPDTFEQVAALLHDPDSAMRRVSAANLLGCLDDETRRSTKPLLEALHDHNFLVRAAAASALAHTADFQAIEPLREAGRDGDPFVHSMARAALSRIGEQRWEKFVEAATRPGKSSHPGTPITDELILQGLSDNDPLIREQAAVNAGNAARSDAVVTSLVAALHDDDAAVRLAAARAVSNRTEAPVQTAMITAADDADESVRTVAIEFLTRMPAEEAIEQLAKHVTEPDAELREAVVAALGATKSSRALTALSTRVGDADDRVLRAVVAALREIKDAKTVPLLRTLSNTADHADVQHAAMIALDERGEPGDSAALLAALTRASPDVRAALAKALGRTHDRSVVNALIALLPEGESTGAEEAGPDGITLEQAAQQALVEITGQSFDSASAWRAWWAENREAAAAEKAGAKRPSGDHSL